ncbi:hypothetical protein BH09PLA1_BH09PLA1_35990 [soil metagenome]
MSDDLSAVARFTCEGCGKQYRWKSQLAGRRVKCAKCGTIMTAPQNPPGDDHDDELYDLVPDERPARKHQQFEYDTELEAGGTGIAMAPPAIYSSPAHPVVKPAAPMFAPGAKPRPVAYRSLARPEARTNEIDNYIGSRKKDLYFPAALILVGTIIEFIRAILIARSPSTGLAYASVYVGVSLIVNTTIMLIGVLLAAKFIGISFGPVGTAILKLCAIAIGPGALVSLISILFPGTSGQAIGMLLSAVLYYTLIAALFELDIQETIWCVIIIGVTRFVVSLMLVALIYRLL